MVGVGVACVGIGFVVYRMPWARWRRSATLVARAAGSGHDHPLQPLHRVRPLRLRHLLPGRLRVARPRPPPLDLDPLRPSARRGLCAAPARHLPHAAGHGAQLGASSSCRAASSWARSWPGWAGLLRRSESANFEAEARFRSAFENAPIGMGLALARRAPGAGQPRLRRHPGLRARRARGQDHQRRHPPRRLGGQRRAVRRAGGRGTSTSTTWRSVTSTPTATRCG